MKLYKNNIQSDILMFDFKHHLFACHFISHQTVVSQINQDEYFYSFKFAFPTQ